MDAAVVAAQAEASVIIIDADRCTRKAALEAMHNYERLGIVPLGAVLANVKMKGRDAAAPEREKKAAPGAAPVKEKKKGRKKEKPAATAVQKGEAAPPAAVPEQAGISAGASRVVEKPAKAEPAAKPVEAAPLSAESAKVEPAAKPVEATPAAAKLYKPGTTARRPGAGEPSWGAAPAVTPSAGAADDLQQVRDSVAEDFRRMGETGAPIPKNWLRALNSNKADVRESATAAITAYYQSFLRRYRINDESIRRITASIIRMMRREDEFASMSEEEAQRHLRQMLMDAGARFSGSDAPSSTPPAVQHEVEIKSAPEKKDEQELRRQEKRRFRLDTRGDRKGKAARKGESQPGDEEGVDWE